MAFVKGVEELCREVRDEGIVPTTPSTCKQFSL